jgi:hypothetical protein
MKEHEMHGAHSMHEGGREGERQMHTKFWMMNLKGRDHLEDLGIDRRIISERSLGKSNGKL